MGRHEKEPSPWGQGLSSEQLLVELGFSRAEQRLHLFAVRFQHGEGVLQDVVGHRVVRCAHAVMVARPGDRAQADG